MSRPDAVIVKLSPREALVAGQVGLARRVEDMMQGAKSANNCPPDGAFAWGANVLGAVGELVVAKHLERYWTLTAMREQDIPGVCEVKATGGHRSDLLLQRSSKPDRRYVLVTFEGFEARLQGWIQGSDGMRDGYWRELQKGRPCYVVPQSALQSMADLIVDPI